MSGSKIVSRICKACGKTFVTSGVAKYCSVRCRSINRANPMNSNYKSGWYLAKSGIREHYDSSLEHQHMLILDTKNISWTKAHGIRIPYWNPALRRNCIYIPDFLVRLPDGYKLVETKPYGLINTPVNQAKFNAAREWCKLNGYTFQVITYPGQI